MPTPCVKFAENKLAFADPAAGIRVAQDIGTDLFEVVVPVAVDFCVALAGGICPTKKMIYARNPKKLEEKPHRIISNLQEDMFSLLFP